MHGATIKITFRFIELYFSFQTFRQISKQQHILALSCPSYLSVRICQSRLALEEFSWRLILEIFIKICQGNAFLINIGQKYRGTLRELRSYLIDRPTRSSTVHRATMLEEIRCFEFPWRRIKCLYCWHRSVWLKRQRQITTKGKFSVLVLFCILLTAYKIECLP